MRVGFMPSDSGHAAQFIKLFREKGGDGVGHVGDLGLLKRTFAVDILHCERCGGRARVIAAITERAVIDKILTHLRAASGNPGLARAPPILPQRQATFF